MQRNSRRNALFSIGVVIALCLLVGTSVGATPNMQTTLICNANNNTQAQFTGLHINTGLNAAALTPDANLGNGQNYVYTHVAASKIAAGTLYALTTNDAAMANPALVNSYHYTDATLIPMQRTGNDDGLIPNCGSVLVCSRPGIYGDNGFQTPGVLEPYNGVVIIA